VLACIQLADQRSCHTHQHCPVKQTQQDTPTGSEQALLRLMLPLQQEAVTLLESRDVNGDIPEEDDAAAEVEGSEGEVEDAARALLGLPGIARGTGMAHLHCIAVPHTRQWMGVDNASLLCALGPWLFAVALSLYTVHAG